MSFKEGTQRGNKMKRRQTFMPIKPGRQKSSFLSGMCVAICILIGVAEQGIAQDAALTGVWKHSQDTTEQAQRYAAIDEATIASELTGQDNASEMFIRSRDLRAEILAKDPSNLRDKSMLMLSEARAGNWKRAAELAADFEKLQNMPPKQHLERARAYAQASRHSEEQKEELVEKSIAALQSAVDQGYLDRFELESEPDLLPIRKLKQFKDLTESVKAQK